MDNSKQSFYFTFGTDPAYPYGINDYVEVKAHSLNEAAILFNAVHPPRPGSDLVNCAFMYTERQFNEFRAELYNYPPVEVIELSVVKIEERM